VPTESAKDRLELFNRILTEFSQQLRVA
jgi:transcription-repair coupling factor (superfamily II helicase)